MILIGSYLSPFVRRVAVTLNVVGVPFEQSSVRVFDNPEDVNKHNPLTRVPTLILDDGEVLVESYAMLDAIDDMVGPEKALIPATGAERRHVMRVAAIGVGTMDKAQWAFYETRFHPKEKVHEPWIEHNDNQVLGGLNYLENLAAKAGDDGWLAGTKKLTQADITGVVSFGFVKAIRGNLGAAEIVPNLAKFAARCEAMEVFSSVAIPS